MIDFLKYIFSDIWYFVGFIVLISVICEGIATIVGAFIK